MQRFIPQHSSVRGIYELPPNRAGEIALYAVDAAGLIVGYDAYRTVMDMGAAIERLEAMLEREDPAVKLEVG